MDILITIISFVVSAILLTVGFCAKDEDEGAKILIVGILIFISAFVFMIVRSHKAHTEFEEKTYALEELDEGIYAITYSTHSEAPAHNYDVLNACINGRIYTFHGKLNIIFSKDTKLVWKDFSIINADILDLYLPRGTVQIQDGISVY